MINTTFTNGSFFSGDYLNPQMNGFKYVTSSDGVEFEAGMSLTLIGNPEDGFSAAYKNTNDNSQSAVSVNDSGVAIESTKKVIINSRPAPTSPNADGQKGEIAFDNDYIYRCVDTNTWKRSDLNTWIPETE